MECLGLGADTGPNPDPITNSVTWAIPFLTGPQFPPCVIPWEVETIQSRTSTMFQALVNPPAPRSRFMFTATMGSGYYHYSFTDGELKLREG